MDELTTLRDRMNQLFEDFFSGSPLARPFGEGRWLPSVDVYETDDEVVIKAETPGMKKDDLQVSATPEAITISGETSREDEVREENFLRRERRRGRFSRTIPLPTAIKPEETKAKFEDGVLEIRAAKEEKAAPAGHTIVVE